MAITSTVSFDVGGTVYKFAHSLLEQHPNTIMTKMVSENWQQDQDTEKKNAEVLFLEGDGGRFKYVLDYMRGGKIFLPASGVSKDAILSDLDYYGFTNVSLSDVQVACAVIESVEYLLSAEKGFAARKQLHDEKKRKNDEEKIKLNTYGFHLDLSFCVYGKFKQNGALTVCLSSSEWASLGEQQPLRINIADFDKCLAPFQLKFVRRGTTRNMITIELEKLLTNPSGTQH